MNDALRQRADEIVAKMAKRSFNAVRARVLKQKDHWGKKKAIERFCEWGEQVALLWAFLRADGLAMDDAALWETLAEDMSTVDLDDVLKLLRGIRSIPDDTHSGLPGWPRGLDRICCAFYPEHAEAIEAILPEVDEEVERGLSSLMARAGRKSRDTMDPDWAIELAKQHIKHYGLGASVGDANGMHLYILWPGRDWDDPKYGVDLWDPANNRPSPAFSELIACLTTPEAWEKACLKVASKGHNIPLARAWDAFRVANIPTLTDLLARMAEPDVRAWQVFEGLRTDLSVAQLLELAAGLVEADHPRIADVAASVAVLRSVEAGDGVPPEALTFLKFLSYEDGYGSGYGTFFEAHERTLEVLRHLPPAQVREMIAARLASGAFMAESALAFVPDFLDDTLWEAALTHIRNNAERKNVLTHWMVTAHSLARMGAEGLPRLSAAFDAAEQADNARLRDGLAWALTETLARLADRNEPWDEAWDRHVRFDLWDAGRDDYYFTHYASPPLVRAMARLPEERLLAVLTRSLDPAQNPAFTRCFGALNTDMPDTALAMAFDALTAHGHQTQQSYTNWVGRSVSSDQLGQRADPFVQTALARGLPTEVADWLRDSMGTQRWQAVQPNEG